MTHRPITNCYWVIPNQFLAGEYPRTQDEETSQEKIDALVNAGVTAFLDLTEADEDLKPYAYFLETYQSKGITHQRFPIRDVSTPRSSILTASVLDAIDHHLKRGAMIYIHCRGGIGRTGTMVGCWLARNGYPGESALNHLHKLWQQCPKSAYYQSPETLEQERYILNWKDYTSTQATKQS